jgi:hypothetical protein
MVHIEDKYIDATGVYDIASAKEDPMGLAVMGFFFEVDNKKPQNMQPLETIDQLVDNMKNNVRRKRDAADDDAQKEEMTRFHAAFEQLFANDNNQRVKRSHGGGDLHEILMFESVALRLNPGAFIRKATNRGYHANDYSTYWTYHGSLTTPTCNEVVTWVVFTRALHIAQVQVNAFTHKFPNNFRKHSNMLGGWTEMRPDTMCGREIMLIHDQIEHHMGGFWG